MDSLALLNALAAEDLAIRTTPGQLAIQTLLGSDGKRYPVPSNLRVLTDDEVIDRGGYVEVKASVCAGAVLLYNLPKALPVWSATSLDIYDKVIGYDGIKPLRVRGFVRNDVGHVTYYLPAEDHQWSWSPGRDVRARTGLGVVMRVEVPASVADLSLIERKQFFASSQVERRMPYTYISRLAGLRENWASLLGSGRSSRFHGQYVPYQQIPQVRSQFDELGDAIREYRRDENPEYMDIDPREPLQWFLDMGMHYLVQRGLNAWNNTTSEYGHDIFIGECGHVDYRNNLVESRDGDICQECAHDGTYIRLEDTGQLVREDAEGVYEHSDGLRYSRPEDDDLNEDEDEDEDEDDSPGLLDYSTNPLEYVRKDRTIKSTPYGDFLMGVELEVISHDGVNRAVRQCTNALGNDYVICKYDGSLNDGGFEIVTAPRGMVEHVRRFNDWQPPSDLTAWDAGCCGMHVHMDSHAFTPITLGKFVEFINSSRNDSLINRIAGRHPHWDEQSREYCSREGQIHAGNPKKTLEGKSRNRYRMVNTTNLGNDEATRLSIPEHGNGRHNTIELRIFRASLNKRRLLAQIEFAHAAVMFCRSASMRELNDKAFLAWLRGFAGVYPHLAKWYGVRANSAEVQVSKEIAHCAEI